MLKLGSLSLGDTPRVAVGFTDANRPSDLKAAKQAGIDVAEVRIDQFRSYEPGYVVEKLASFKAIPTLATIRIEDEGGAWRGPEAERRKLFEAIIPHVNAVDIELGAAATLKAIAPIVHKHRKLLVVSFHDFKTTPTIGRLEKIINDAKAAGADIVKIATTVTDQSHISLLTTLLIKHADKNLIVIGMGAAGLVTRLYFPALGSLLTFAAVAGQPTAPGQLPYIVMLDALRLVYPSYNEFKINSLKLMEFI